VEKSRASDFELRGKRRDMNEEVAKQEDEGSLWFLGKMVLCLLMGWT